MRNEELPLRQYGNIKIRLFAIGFKQEKINGHQQDSLLELILK